MIKNGCRYSPIVGDSIKVIFDKPWPVTQITNMASPRELSCCNAPEK